MGIIGTLNILSTFNAGGLIKGVNQSRKALDSFNKNANKAGRGIRGIGPASASSAAQLKTLASGAGVALGPLTGLAGALAGVASIGAAFGAGVKLSAEMETAEVAFTTMLGSADKAKEVLGELSTFAASTPFQFSELRDGAQQLLAFGFTADETQGLMKTLGDVAAGSGKPIADFVDILGKTKASGVAGLGDIMRLADRGVPIFQLLANEMGVAQEQVKGLVSSGKVGMPQVLSALEAVTSEGGLFANAMEKQSGTLAGLWSTLKDNVGASLREVGDFITSEFDLKSVVASMTSFVQRGIAVFKDWTPVISAFVGMMVSRFTATWDILKEGWNTASNFLAPIFEKMIPDAIKQIDDWRLAFLTLFTFVETGFNEWRTVFDIVAQRFQLVGHMIANDAQFVFGEILPAAVDGFAEFVVKRIQNIPKMLRQQLAGDWSGLWEDLAMDAAESFGGIPALADREMTNMERLITDDLERLEGQFEKTFMENLRDRAAGLAADEPMKKLADETSKVTTAFNEATVAAEDLITKLQDQIDTFGMTSTEAEIFRLRQKGAAEDTLANVAALDEQLRALERNKKAMEAVNGAADTITDALDGFSVEQQFFAADDLAELENTRKHLQAQLDAGFVDPSGFTDGINEALQEVVSKLDEQKQFAESTIESVKTDLEKLDEQRTKLNDALAAGLIDQETFDRAIKKAQEQLGPSSEVQFSGALERGSAAARDALLRNRFGGDKAINKVEANTRQQLVVLREQKRVLVDISKKAATETVSIP